MRIKADKLVKARERILEVIGRSLTDDHLLEMQRRAEYVAGNDGFGTGGSSGHSTDVSRPTERTAIALLDHRYVSDPQAKAAEIIVTELLAMRTAAIRIEKAWGVIEHITDGRYGHQSSLQSCGACLRDDVTGIEPDRIKANYCPACYTEYRRQGMPDRLVFELSRRADPA